MPNPFLQELSAVITVDQTHLVPVSDDPGGTGDLKKATVAQLNAALDHSLLTGLDNDDHPQYAPVGHNHDGVYAAIVHTHGHASLTGLNADDHSQYALLAGRAGGQTLRGGTGAGEHLTLESTSHATKGQIRLFSTNLFITSQGGIETTTGFRGIGLGMGPANSYDVIQSIGAISLWPASSDAVTIRSRNSDASRPILFLRTGNNLVAGLVPTTGVSLKATNLPLQVEAYSDATRPASGTAGRVIFNTTDGNLNIDNGTNWILPDGTIT